MRHFWLSVGFFTLAFGFNFYYVKAADVCDVSQLTGLPSKDKVVSDLIKEIQGGLINTNSTDKFTEAALARQIVDQIQIKVEQNFPKNLDAEVEKEINSALGGNSSFKPDDLEGRIKACVVKGAKNNLKLDFDKLEPGVLNNLKKTFTDNYNYKNDEGVGTFEIIKNYLKNLNNINDDAAREGARADLANEVGAIYDAMLLRLQTDLCTFKEKATGKVLDKVTECAKAELDKLSKEVNAGCVDLRGAQATVAQIFERIKNEPYQKYGALASILNALTGYVSKIQESYFRPLTGIGTFLNYLGGNLNVLRLASANFTISFGMLDQACTDGGAAKAKLVKDIDNILATMDGSNTDGGKSFAPILTDSGSMKKMPDGSVCFVNLGNGLTQAEYNAGYVVSTKIPSPPFARTLVKRCYAPGEYSEVAAANGGVQYMINAQFTFDGGKNFLGMNMVNNLKVIRDRLKELADPSKESYREAKAQLAEVNKLIETLEGYAGLIRGSKEQILNSIDQYCKKRKELSDMRDLIAKMEMRCSMIAPRVPCVTKKK